MSSVPFARNERHRLMGLLLKIRVGVYGLIAIPVMAASEVDLGMRFIAAAILLVAAVAPFLVRRTGRYSGVRISAGIDAVMSFVLWVVLPGAAGLTLLVTIWTVGVVVFFSRRITANRFVVAVIALELAKVAFVLLAPETVTRTQDGLVWLVLGRAIAIGAAFLVMRALDEYFQRLSIAAETGSQRYQRLMDTAPTAFLVVNDGTIAYANTAASEFLGSAADDLVGAAFTDFIADDSKAQMTDRIGRAIDRLEPFTLAGVAMRDSSGEEMYADAAVMPIDFDSELAVQVALHDVSAQRKAETELLETKLNYRSFFERIPVALYRSRPNGEIIQANRALVELLGARSESELVGVNARSFYVDVGDRDHLTSILAERRIVVGYEARMRRTDGSEIWVRDTSRLIETDIGDIYEGAMVDVTGRRNIEDELWARAVQQEAAASIGQTALEGESIATVMRSVTETVARVLRTDGAVVLARDAAGSFVILGQSASMELSAASVSTLADRAHMTAAPVVVRSRQELAFTAPNLAADGVESAIAIMIPGTDIDFGTLLVLSNTERVFTSDDLNFLHSVANVLAAAVDRASAYGRLEELLRSKDAFVASVSHELRTPLTVVSGMALELNERWAELGTDELAEFTAMLVEQSQDMADLIEDLLVAARANIGNVTVVNEPIELDRQVRSVLASIAIPADRTISSQLAEGIVDADAIRVRQIVRNLITNAIRYGGPTIEVTMSSTAGTHVVEVIDDGPGIPAADRDRVFIAYERAHHAEGQPESVGLGLTVSRTLAELMGGSLTYRFDTRSVFRLELPRNAEQERAHHLARPVATEPRPRAEGAIGMGRIGVDVGVID
jgi:PAS domain S-box-containing protein